MNNARRKELKRASSLIKEAVEIIDIAREEEQGAFDNLHKGIQESEKGRTMEEYVNALNTLISDLEYVNALDTLISDLEYAETELNNLIEVNL